METLVFNHEPSKMMTFFVFFRGIACLSVKGCSNPLQDILRAAKVLSSSSILILPELSRHPKEHATNLHQSLDGTVNRVEGLISCRCLVRDDRGTRLFDDNFLFSFSLILSS